MAPHNVLCEKNELDMQITLTAMATYPTLDEASDFLNEVHRLQCSPEKMRVLEKRFPKELAEARKRAAPILEAKAAADMLDTASMALHVQQIAIAATRTALAEGHVKDPAKVARDLADVGAKAIDKRQLLEARPTVITQDKTPEEIIKRLETLGVFKKEADAETTAVDTPLLPAG
jgi:hypothetical protein